jgi:hypothetical protein
MNDTPTLVRFSAGWEPDGVGSDGMPIYRENIMIHLDRPPYLRVSRVAEPYDIAENPGPFSLFQKEQASRTTSYAEGYPLALWPACTEAEFRMLADRDIVTVEQLAGLHRKNRGADDTMPPEIRVLAERAAKLMELQGSKGKFEELLRDRDGQIEALKEQVAEASKTIASLQTMVDTLKMRSAG